MTAHYLVFIHGIGERKPSDRPFDSYDDLWRRIGRRYPDGQAAFNERFKPIYTDWHVNPLQNAEAVIQTSAFPNLAGQFLNPIRGMREFMTFFLGDVIAYVSEDVNFIRRTVWQQVWQQLQQPLKLGATYSIVAHSLGSIIAFDYLYDLFKLTADGTPNSELFVPAPDSSQRSEDRHINDVDRPTPDELNRLKTQFRHFFTLGSPIGLFMMRKGSLWSMGEPFVTLYNPVRGDRVWCNFWDGQDLIAYPLVNLFARNSVNQDCQLIDVRVETGFLIFDSHTKYWENNEVAATIAKTL